MRARKPKFYSLKRPKLRQSWNKFNLYNLARQALLPYRFGRSFFQQKWAAKAMTRGYHGPHIKESHWERMFSRRLLSTVELPPEYLAAYDGSEQSAGRGSGRQLESSDGGVVASKFSETEYKLHKQRLADGRAERNPGRPSHFSQAKGGDRQTKLLRDPTRTMTPYMQMTFAPLERRLDVAIFRALFASSTLQARQFCVHGAVKVNGIKMKYPAYKLNPGDLFQVDPERVLFATGMPKNTKETERLKAIMQSREAKEAALDAKKATERAVKKRAIMDKLESAKAESPAAEASEQAAADTPVEAESEAAIEAAAEDVIPVQDTVKAQKQQLKALIKSAKALISDGQGMNAKKKQQLRLFNTEAKRAVSRFKPTAAKDVEEADSKQTSSDHIALMNQLSSLLRDFKLDGSAVQMAPSNAEDEKPAPKNDTVEELSRKLVSKSVKEQLLSLSTEEQLALKTLLKEDAENPVDETKPYMTPWRPRNYMSPFAFIPRYLEVNQNICSAVYLRHPVARKGLAEVPTPFPYETNQLAFNWYLRRR